MTLRVNEICKDTIFASSKITIDKNITYVKCSFYDCVLTMASNDWINQFKDCDMENVEVINKDGEHEITFLNINPTLKNDPNGNVITSFDVKEFGAIPSTSEIVKDVAKNYMDNMIVNCNMEGSSGIKEEVSAWSVNGEIKPQDDVRVLIKDDDENVFIATYTKYDEQWNYGDSYGNKYDDYEVTHWMYIPI